MASLERQTAQAFSVTGADSKATPRSRQLCRLVKRLPAKISMFNYVQHAQGVKTELLKVVETLLTNVGPSVRYPKDKATGLLPQSVVQKTTEKRAT